MLPKAGVLIEAHDLVSVVDPVDQSLGAIWHIDGCKVAF